jgi:hypothetical protein
MSKRVRFEVFKRDKFTCGYCGRHPPDVLLHVDHITAVANGGTDDPLNLVTACSDCNLGKAAVRLTSVAPSLEAQAEDALERAEQIRAYAEMVAQAQTARADVAAAYYKAFNLSLETGCGEDPPPLQPLDSEIATMRNFAAKLTAEELFEAIEIAKTAATYKPHLRTAMRPDGPSKWTVSNLDARWRYFCGICWKKIRDREEEGK